MGMNRRLAVAVVGLLLAALACTCSLNKTIGALGTAQAVAQTAQGVITEVGPTMEIELTQFQTLESLATQHGPDLNMTLTSVVGTADALGAPGAVGTAEAVMTQMMGTANAQYQQGGNAAPPVYTGNDGLTTSFVGVMAVGDTRNSQLDSADEAHNWVFNGQAGQSVRVQVTGVDRTDPHVLLIDPNGNTLTDFDDIDFANGNLNVDFTTSLPADGQYTVRINVYVTGAYSVSVSNQ